MKMVRTSGSAVAGALAALCVLVGLVSSVVGAALLDSRGFERAFAPTIRDEAVQQIITDALGDAVVDQLHAQDLTQELEDYLAEAGAPSRLRTGVGRLSEFALAGVEATARNQIGRVVASDTFATAWDATLRTVHSAIMTPLTTDSPTALVRLDADGTLWLRTSNMADAVRAQIESRSRVVAGLLPTDRVADLKLVQHPALAQARTAARVTPALLALPWALGIVFGALALWWARDRRAGLVRWGLLTGAALVILGAMAAWMPLGLSGTAGTVADALASGLRAQIVALALGVGAALLLVAGWCWWWRRRAHGRVAQAADASSAPVSASTAAGSAPKESTRTEAGGPGER
ncbi:MAG: hypothetical protein LBE25_13020 [Arthrobacter sp.]|jgi:hypothetical protein|nr:hypothetical protein [Arthrobacter sp.]